MLDFKLIKSVVKGAITFIPGSQYFLDKKKKKSIHSGSDALFSYSLWLSNLSFLKENSIQPDFSRVAEIGNGGSLGIAFCAILTGADKYFSFEFRENIDFLEQIQLLERISLLFDKSEPIHHYERINIRISDYSFPEDEVLPIIQRKRLVKQLKQDLQNELVGSDLISLINNWEIQSPLNITYGFSRAVMEHVNDPKYIYQKIYTHLVVGALMLHDIEFHSHGITVKTNGHYKISLPLWKIIHGKREFYLNRFMFDDHMNSIKKCGFKYLKSDIVYEDLNSSRKNLNGAVIIAQKVSD